MDFSLSVNTKYMEKLRVELNQTDAEVLQDALSVLRWVVDEAKKGRLVVSAAEDGTSIERLSMLSVNNILKERGVKLIS